MVGRRRMEMNKMTLIGQFSKTLGYLAFGLNNVLRFVGTATNKASKCK